MALTRLRGCAGWPEPLLLADLLITVLRVAADFDILCIVHKKLRLLKDEIEGLSTGVRFSFRALDWIYVKASVYPKIIVTSLAFEKA